MTGLPKQEECDITVKYIYITQNGKTIAQNLDALRAKGLLDETNNTLKLENITTDTRVVVVLSVDGKLPVNVDSNDDDIPDVNIDRDGDGIPEFNIDTDGDGVPDKNIDRNGNGIIDSEEIIKTGDNAPLALGGWFILLIVAIGSIAFSLKMREN